MKSNIKIVRITTVPISLKVLLQGQMGYMNEKGMEVLAMSAAGAEVEEVKKYESVQHYSIPFTREITPLIDLYCLLKLVVFFIKHKPTIVHTHTPKAGLLGMLAARIARVPIKVHTIAGLPLMTATGLKRRILTITEKLTYGAADQVLANSNSILNYLVENDLINPAKLNIIGTGSSNGFDEQKFNKENINHETLAEIKTLLNYDSKNFYLLFVGRMVVDKGIVELVEAFEKLHVKHPRLRLVLLGEFEEELSPIPISIKEKIKQHSAIIHIGWGNDVECFLSLANVLVHPSFREGFPNIVLQAAALGCPIMCSEIPGNIDIVKTDKFGYRFSVKNVSAIVQTFEKLYSEYHVALTKAEELKSFVWNNFTRSKIHQQIYLYYIDLLDRAGLINVADWQPAIIETISEPSQQMIANTSKHQGAVINEAAELQEAIL